MRHHIGYEWYGAGKNLPSIQTAKGNADSRAPVMQAKAITKVKADLADIRLFSNKGSKPAEVMDKTRVLKLKCLPHHEYN